MDAKQQPAAHKRKMGELVFKISKYPPKFDPQREILFLCQSQFHTIPGKALASIKCVCVWCVCMWGGGWLCVWVRRESGKAKAASWEMLSNWYFLLRSVVFSWGTCAPNTHPKEIQIIRIDAESDLTLAISDSYPSTHKLIKINIKPHPPKMYTWNFNLFNSKNLAYLCCSY